MQGDIESLASRIFDRFSRAQLHGRLRRNRLKPGQPWCQPFFRDGRQGHEAQGWGAGLFPGNQARFGNHVEGRTQGLHVGSTGRRQLHTSRLSLEQGSPQPLFQLLDLLADSTGADSEFL